MRFVLLRNRVSYFPVSLMAACAAIGTYRQSFHIHTLTFKSAHLWTLLRVEKL